MKKFWAKLKAWFGGAVEEMQQDKQDAAFKNAPAFTNKELQVALNTGELLVDDAPIKTPEEYEAENWDAKRTRPKTPAEAKAEIEEGVDWV
jgi:hypothetical protein